MYKTTNEGVPTPTANIAINNSRIKLYGKTSEVPTYYLQKGQEFQIELHNPTKDTIMAKISLNGKPIAQGGLVLKPAQRVFLDRYIDVAKKFKFDTYEVTNSSENRKAIEDNGDFRVEFYKEQTPPPIKHTPIFINTDNSRGFGGNVNTYWNNTTTGDNSGISGQSLGLTSVGASASASNYSAENIPTMDSMDSLKDFSPLDALRRVAPEATPEPTKKKRKTLRSKKSIETGRVEQGSVSNQTLTTVYMNWESTAFHTVEYKMQPLSQKTNTVDNIKVKRYCTNCGNKQKPNFKFCPSCGTKA